MKLRLTVPASKAESLLSPKMQETGPREQGIPEAATCIIGPQKHLGKLFQSFPLHNIKSNIVGVEIIQNQNEIKIFSIECIKLVTYFNYCSILVLYVHFIFFPAPPFRRKHAVPSHTTSAGTLMQPLSIRN